MWKSQPQRGNKWVPLPSDGCSFKFHKNERTFKIFRGLNQIFLGKEAKTTEGIWDFYKLIKKNESSLNHKRNNEKLLPTKVCISICSKVQWWLAQCEIAHDRSEVNDGIVVVSVILEDIWDNWFPVHLPSMFKVKPIHQGGETPFGQSPFGLGNPGGDIEKKRKGISGGEVDNRVSNDNADKDFKLKQNEDWAKVFYGTKVIHRIKWNNNGCLMCPCWF